MNTSLISVSWTLTGLLLAGAAQPVSVQAQLAAPNAQIAPATAIPAVASSPAQVFVPKPVGIVADVDKLARAGTDPAVMKAYIQNWRTPYSVSADNLLYQHSLGVPSDVLTTLIQHQSELSGQGFASGPNPVPVQPSAPVPYQGGTLPAGQPLIVPQPAPDQYIAPPTYPVDASVYSYPAYPAYPAYDYYYGYPGCYYPGVVVGFGFGYRGYRGYSGYYGGFGGHGGGFGGHGGGFGGHGGGGGHR